MATLRDPNATVTDAQVQQFHRDGFLVVPNLYSDAQMQHWKSTLAQALQDLKAAAAGGVHVWMSNELPPLLQEAVRDDKVAPILQRLIGPNVEFLSAKVVFKNKATGFGTPWHQDRSYWGGPAKTSVWIAMDDARIDNGCLKMIPGSHREVFDHGPGSGDAFALRIDDSRLAGMKVQTMELARGGAVFFHDLTLHASHPNATGGDRWSFISTYRDASVPDDSKVWSTAMLLCGASVNVK